MADATRTAESIVTTPQLLLAFELSAKSWLIGFRSTAGDRVRRRQLAARDTATLVSEVAAAKAAFGLPADAAVQSCYEAGRDGFWLHRWLDRQGVQNRVVDSASIEVPRRKRRTKTDALDLTGLLRLLVREVGGERRVWRVVRVPSVEAEDARQLERELEATQADRTRVRNRVQSLLATQGAAMPPWRHVRERLAVVRTAAGELLPPGLQARLGRELTWLATIDQRLRELRRRQRAGLSSDSVGGRLQTLRGIGVRSAGRLSREVFDWRTFTSGRQVGALVGLTPTPYASGGQQREQGISKAGNRRVRTLMVEVARGWCHFQPTSALTQWFETRFAHGSARLRRIGLVALARKLLIALWRFVTTGTVPAGADRKPLAA
jgi:transposase